MNKLDITYRGTVAQWHCDHMGHMNVMWYVGKFDEATWAAVQQNITYRRELLAGDTVAVRSAFLEVRERVAKFVHEMRNAVTGEISAICVLTGVQIDTQTRKSCPFPAQLAERAA